MVFTSITSTTSTTSITSARSVSVLVATRLRVARVNLRLRDLSAARTPARLPHAIRHGDQHLGRVVLVVALGEHVTETVGIERRTRLAALRGEGRIHRDADQVTSRANWLLLVRQKEELASEPFEIRVGVADRDALKSIDRRVAAVPVHPRAWRLVLVVRVDVDHAETALARLDRRAADRAAGVDGKDLVRRVVAEMEVLVTVRELVNAVAVAVVAVPIGIDVIEWAADEHVSGTDVRRRDGESERAMRAALETAFDRCASRRGERLLVDHPRIGELVLVDDEIRHAVQILHPGEGGG